ncbi:MAG: hypothetical protein DHS20C17_13820 [Cyclobacteriaceae bacterium]|nr:MAG: hypothetical protein DHS20C17_13820 [Cyclobacteriaceae bacterium]
MYPLFESIKVVDGRLINLEWHQRRVDFSRNRIYGDCDSLELLKVLTVPAQYRDGIIKCRVSYGLKPGPVAFSHYTKRSIRSLQQVECSPFDYGLKYEDRSKLKQLFQLRGACDEVLITINGLVTDTSYSNVALFDGSNWYTPDQPLLHGTQRDRLLASGVIKQAAIRISDLHNFDKLVLINAMVEFDPENYVNVPQVRLWNQRRVVV